MEYLEMLRGMLIQINLLLNGCVELQGKLKLTHKKLAFLLQSYT